jgi:geranylgeranyl diphosphate synthase type II
MGDALGVAYQLADDLYDVLTPPSDGDKPTQRDAALAHPNAARVLGVDGARHAFERALDSACHAIPGDACTDDAQRERLSALVRELGARLVPPRASVTRSSAA